MGAPKAQQQQQQGRSKGKDAKAGNKQAGNKNIRMSLEDEAAESLGSSRGREWPPWLVSHSESSFFVNRDLRVREDVPACQGVRPDSRGGVNPSRVTLGRSWRDEELLAVYGKKVPARAVVWSAKMGLGNSLRGLIHTFIFALMSGRELIVSTSGLYGVAMATLYEGFEGRLDRAGDMQSFHVRLPSYNIKHPDLQDPRPLVYGDPNQYHNAVWYFDPKFRACVFGAMQCTSIWCVHSKIIASALGGPKLPLAEAIDAVVQMAPWSMAELQRFMESSTAVAQPGKQAASGNASVEQVQVPQGLDVKFKSAFSKENLNIVYGKASSMLGDMSEEEGESASLRLKFDVAIHVRTIHKCVEHSTDQPHCHDRGAEHSFSILKQFPELKPSVSVHQWSCVSNLLSFLLQLKWQRQLELKEDFRTLFQMGGDREELLRFLNISAKSPGTRPKTSAAPRPGSTPQGGLPDAWTVEDAQAVVAEARSHFAGLSVEALQSSTPSVLGKAGLAIFIATDSEVLRPLFVEYLRPFGTVAFSNVSVVHSAHRKTNKHGNRLGNLAEFYLLSRAAVLINFHRRKSTFAYMAAKYGNSTFLTGVDKLQCDFIPQHLGEEAADRFGRIKR